MSRPRAGPHAGVVRLDALGGGERVDVGHEPVTGGIPERCPRRRRLGLGDGVRHGKLTPLHVAEVASGDRPDRGRPDGGRPPVAEKGLDLRQGKISDPLELPSLTMELGPP